MEVPEGEQEATKRDNELLSSFQTLLCSTSNRAQLHFRHQFWLFKAATNKNGLRLPVSQNITCREPSPEDRAIALQQPLRGLSVDYRKLHLEIRAITFWEHKFLLLVPQPEQSLPLLTIVLIAESLIIVNNDNY